MKKLLYSLAAIAVIVSSCTRESMGWDSMELSTEELVFDSNGGEEEIICFNYSGIWVNYIFDNTLNQYYRNDPKNPHFCKTDTPGVSVSSKKEKITVSVDPSNEKRRWGISLQAGNTFSYIDVYQNDAPKK